MKKKTAAVFTVLLMLIGALSATETSAGTVIQRRNTGSFTSVNFKGPGKLILHQGPVSVSITGNSGVCSKFKTETVNGKLIAGYKSESLLSALKDGRYLKDCVIDVSVPQLDRLELYGSGVILSDDFSFHKLSIDMHGGSLLRLKGSADELALTCTGAVNAALSELGAARAAVGIKGAAKAELHVLEYLDVSVNGAGFIRYSGNPEVRQKIRGDGKIEHLE